jgi:hypothetical protein
MELEGNGNEAGVEAGGLFHEVEGILWIKQTTGLVFFDTFGGAAAVEVDRGIDPFLTLLGAIGVGNNVIDGVLDGASRRGSFSSASPFMITTKSRATCPSGSSPLSTGKVRMGFWSSSANQATAMKPPSTPTSSRPAG